MEPTGDIALIGLAVMGQNLILNMNDHGFTVVAYNRTVEKVDHFLANEAKGTKVLGAHSIEEMVSKLKSPRRVMMLVKAGKPVDEFIEQLIPHLSPGDIIIDGGNSLFDDTNRRQKYVESKGLVYIGTGVSGGEEKAHAKVRASCPGRSPAAWPDVKEIFQAVSEKGGRQRARVVNGLAEMGGRQLLEIGSHGLQYGELPLICKTTFLEYGFDFRPGNTIFTHWTWYSNPFYRNSTNLRQKMRRPPPGQFRTAAKAGSAATPNPVQHYWNVIRAR